MVHRLRSRVVIEWHSMTLFSRYSTQTKSLKTVLLVLTLVEVLAKDLLKRNLFVYIDLIWDINILQLLLMILINVWLHRQFSIRVFILKKICNSFMHLEKIIHSQYILKILYSQFSVYFVNYSFSVHFEKFFILNSNFQFSIISTKYYYW